jgi:hypothetical protein|tara:strand:- start:82 stop:375 length:294 start_codon:yes stop_codon:yes gene_type:complete
MVIDFGYDRAYSSLKALYVNASDKAYCDKRWGVWNEYGLIAIVYAHHEQEALDVIVDESTKLDSCLVEFSEANYEDCCSLGNAGELFDLSYIGMKEI